MENKAKDGGFYSLKFQEFGFFTLKERGFMVSTKSFQEEAIVKNIQKRL